MAGHGRQQPELMALAQQLGIGDRVRFVGFVTGQEKINYTARRRFLSVLAPRTIRQRYFGSAASCWMPRLPPTLS